MNITKTRSKRSGHMSNKMWRAQAHRLEGKVRNLGIKSKKKLKRKEPIFDLSVPFEDEFISTN
jgi:GH43 family beta-xylosidase